MKQRIPSLVLAWSRRASLPCAIVGLCLALAACEEPRPRTFADFTEDPIARDGTLARCKQHAEQSLNDIECSNASRAAQAIALREERRKREAFEVESRRQIEDLKRQIVERERIAREEALSEARAEREAYEALWREQNGVLANPVQLEQAQDRLSLIELPDALTGE
jgi:hypothetical protein